MTLYNRQHVLDIIKPFNLLLPLEEIEYYREKGNSWSYDITLVPASVQDYGAWLVFLNSMGIAAMKTEYLDMIIIALEDDEYLTQSAKWDYSEWHKVPAGHL